jgi:hypothetical protein
VKVSGCLTVVIVVVIVVVRTVVTLAARNISTPAACEYAATDLGAALCCAE